jgi:aryl-alcohol dehydrogenase-like predicted oxidoreductase
MQKRPFGKEQTPVSEVGLGCWQLGGNWGEVSVETAHGILAAAVDAGVTFIDTADVYGDGRSESIIGDFLKTRSETLFVATKLGRSSDLYPEGYALESVRQHVLDSCERLGVKSLDLIQTHCVPPEVMDQGDIYDWLRQIKEEGLIKRFGASVETVEEGINLIKKVHGLDSLQVIFNVFRQKPIEQLFSVAKQHQVAIIARVPLASGLLSGKYSSATSFGEDDHRNFNADGQCFNVGETFAGVPYTKGLELVDQMKDWVPADMNMVQMALRWILDFEVVTTVIPGASKVEQAINNASASDLAELSNDVHDKLRVFYAQQVHAHVRGVY